MGIYIYIAKGTWVSSLMGRLWKEPCWKVGALSLTSKTDRVNVVIATLPPPSTACTLNVSRGVISRSSLAARFRGNII